MKSKRFRVAALILSAALALSGCGGTAAQTGGDSSAGGSEGTPTVAEPIKDLVTYQLANNEMSTFLIQSTEIGADMNVLTNMYEALLEVDTNGQLVPALAEEWGSEDGGKTWTFHLREGVKWVDINGNEKAECTAQDFLTGLEWVLNFHKNNATNISMPTDLIQGAEEYYEYTKELSSEEGLALDLTKFKEMVGVSAPDDYTLEFTCTKAAPYFDTVACYVCLYPLPQGLIDEVGVENVSAINNETTWYNGCYIMTSYVQGNEKVLTKNESYWDTDAQLFDTVTIKMVESDDVAFQLYQTGEIDNVTLTESNLKTISSSQSNEYYDQLVEARPTKYSYGIHFNFDKHFADGSTDDNWNTAAANLAFRLAWYYGLDLTDYLARYNGINPLKCENNAYTTKGLVKLSDGTDYVELVEEQLNLPESNGVNIARLDTEKAAQYKQQAIEELTAKGVTFPVEADLYIAGDSQTELNNATVLKQIISDGLGDDFVTVNIKTYVSSKRTEVAAPRLHSFLVNGWSADYGDPQNFLGQETYGEDTAFYSLTWSYVNDSDDEELIAEYQEFTDLVNAANAITDDLDARYRAYAVAEAYMIQHAFVIPSHYEIEWQLTHINDYSKMYGMFGCQNNKYKNWETSVDGYTTEQYEAFAEAADSSDAE